MLLRNTTLENKATCRQTASSVPQREKAQGLTMVPTMVSVRKTPEDISSYLVHFCSVEITGVPWSLISASLVICCNQITQRQHKSQNHSNRFDKWSSMGTVLAWLMWLWVPGKCYRAADIIAIVFVWFCMLRETWCNFACQNRRLFDHRQSQVSQAGQNSMSKPLCLCEICLYFVNDNPFWSTNQPDALGHIFVRCMNTVKLDNNKFVLNNQHLLIGHWWGPPMDEDTFCKERTHLLWTQFEISWVRSGTHGWNWNNKNKTIPFWHTSEAMSQVNQKFSSSDRAIDTLQMFLNKSVKIIGEILGLVNQISC